jgi:membrane-associated protein
VLNPTHLLNVFGTIGIFAILFAETGLLVGIVLPGDSLLFTAGLLSSIHRTGDVHLNLFAVMGAALLGAVLGAETGYILGRNVGPRLFKRPDSRFFKQQYVERTHVYLEKYGPARAVMLARFVPVVRTLMNPLAGAVNMDSGVFTAANFVGGVLWAIGVTLAGYLLGKSIHNVDHYILPIVAVIIVASLIPVGLEIRKSRRERAGQATAAQAGQATAAQAVQAAQAGQAAQAIAAKDPADV